MPLLCTTGAAPLSAFGFGRLEQSVRRVGYGVGLTSGSATYAVSWPSGTLAGDLALVYVPFQGTDLVGNPTANASVTGGAGGSWTKSNLSWGSFGYYSAVFSKVLASGDLTGNTVTTPNSISNPVLYVVYRGATAATVKSTNTGASGTTMTLTGFTKGACKGVVSFASDRDVPATPSCASPFFNVAGPGGGTNFTASLADVTAENRYISGTDVVWSSFGGTFQQTGYLLELT